MMKLSSIILSAFTALAFMGAFTTTATLINGQNAQAQTRTAKMIVDAAITEGIVGETASGYLALVNGTASPEITNAMNEINIGRKTVYTRLARAQNVQVEIVAALTGEKQLAGAAPGTKVLTKAGRWITVR